MVYIYVGIGGIVGTFLRYLGSILSVQFFENEFAGTLFVNLVGAFVLGWFSAISPQLKRMNPEVKSGISSGVIGSFTTFSTLCVDVVHLGSEYEVISMVLYVLLSVVGGCVSVFAGYLLGMKQRRKVRME